MLTVTIPDDNQPERRYIVEMLLEGFQGLRIELLHKKIQYVTLKLENGNQLIFEDHFFGKFPSEKSYLDSKSIPQKVLFQTKDVNPFIPENDLPVIFGSDRLEVSAKEIVCGVDIFASAFFMLTRWEENVINERDGFGRFPANASLAARAGFLHRPVVNEYVEMLWNMLRHLGIRQKRKKRECQLMLTHDVDYPRLWPSPFFFLKKLSGDVLRRHSLKEASFSLRSYYSTKARKEKDPYDTFDYLMEMAERRNVPAHFFFVAGGTSKLDPKYDIAGDFVKKLMEGIDKRGHRIGIHPSYHTFYDQTRWQQEKKRLEHISPQPVTFGRQHFLRFAVPQTWQIWDDNDMAWDATLGYPDSAGFRCGTCTPFPTFNFLTRKKLKLKEYPLTAMDITWTAYRKNTCEEILSEVDLLSGKVRKYGGVFVLLWHNSSFNVPEFQPLQGVYEKILGRISSHLNSA